MNPVLLILMMAAALLIFILLSALYRPIGILFSKLLGDAADAIKHEEKSDNEKE